MGSLREGGTPLLSEAPFRQNKRFYGCNRPLMMAKIWLEKGNGTGFDRRALVVDPRARVQTAPALVKAD